VALFSLLGWSNAYVATKILGVAGAGTKLEAVPQRPSLKLPVGPGLTISKLHDLGLFGCYNSRFLFSILLASSQLISDGNYDIIWRVSASRGV